MFLRQVNSLVKPPGGAHIRRQATRSAERPMVLLLLLLFSFHCFVLFSCCSIRTAECRDSDDGGKVAQQPTTTTTTASPAADGPLPTRINLATVKSICSNSKVPVADFKTMLDVIKMVRADESLCNERYHSPLFELEPILITEPDAFCEPQSIDRIRDFHFRFIQQLRDLSRMPTQFQPLPRQVVKKQLFAAPDHYTVDFDEAGNTLAIPIAVRHFFLKLALQVSYTCKKDLIYNLFHDVSELLTDDDRAIMALFDHDAPIGQTIASGVKELDFDSVLYIKELDGELSGANSGDEKTVHLKTSASENSALFEMVLACRNRFRPIYDTLVMPIVKLSKMGYDYQGDKFNDMEKSRLTGSKMKLWLVIMHVCQLMDNIILVDGTSANLKPSEPHEEGDVEPLDEEERKKLLNLKRLELANPIKYAPTRLCEMDQLLMIDGGEHQLDLELSRKAGHKNPFGFGGFMRKLFNLLKKGLAKFDMERFGHYRRHSLWYNGVANFLSGLSNVVGVPVTVMATFGVFG